MNANLSDFKKTVNHCQPDKLVVYFGSVAAGMDPSKLKEKFGKDLVFWGGGADTQKVLPNAKPEKVREETLRMCEILGKDGGFVFNTVHNIQANVPLENMVAMIEAIREFNK